MVEPEMRCGVRVGPAAVTAEFSNLGGGEEAALLNQTLFLEMTPETVLDFVLSSEHHQDITGPVQL